MYKTYSRLFLLVSVLILASLACSINLGNTPTPTPDTSMPPAAPAVNPTTAPQKPTAKPAQATATKVPPSPTPLPPTKTMTPTQIPFKPVGIREGLASLNSYRFKIDTILNGPTAQDKSHTINLIEYNKDSDSSHNQTTVTSSTAKDPKENTITTDTYQIGNKSCTISGAEEKNAKITENDPLNQEMREVTGDLMDIIPNIQKAKFIGVETVSGVKTNHFKFTPGGLGKKSGAQVSKSSGDYWLAQDGQYLVKYVLILETRTAPEGNPNAKVMYTEVQINLSDINQAIEISMPANCQ
jgi:hypothetical protein